MSRTAAPAVAAVLLLVCAGSAAGSAAWAKPSADTVRRAAASVVRVVAEGCPGGQGSRAGTGLVWSATKQVVTALHVLADCSRVAVENVELGVQPRAETQRAVRRAARDLLPVEAPPPGPVRSPPA